MKISLLKILILTAIIFSISVTSVFSIEVTPGKDVEIEIKEISYEGDKITIPIKINFGNPNKYKSVAIAFDVIDPDVGPSQKLFCLSPYRTSLFHKGQWSCTYGWPNKEAEAGATKNANVGTLSGVDGKTIDVSNFLKKKGVNNLELTVTLNKNIFQNKEYRIDVGLWKSSELTVGFEVVEFSCVGIPPVEIGSWNEDGKKTIKDIYPEFDEQFKDKKLTDACGGKLDEYRYAVASKTIKFEGTGAKVTTGELTKSSDEKAKEICKEFDCYLYEVKVNVVADNSVIVDVDVKNKYYNVYHPISSPSVRKTDGSEAWYTGGIKELSLTKGDNLIYIKIPKMWIPFETSWYISVKIKDKTTGIGVLSKIVTLDTKVLIDSDKLIEKSTVSSVEKKEVRGTECTTSSNCKGDKEGYVCIEEDRCVKCTADTDCRDYVNRVCDSNTGKCKEAVAVTYTCTQTQGQTCETGTTSCPTTKKLVVGTCESGKVCCKPLDKKDTCEEAVYPGQLSGGYKCGDKTYTGNPDNPGQAYYCCAKKSTMDSMQSYCVGLCK